jgi:hypothetical protein
MRNNVPQQMQLFLLHICMLFAAQWQLLRKDQDVVSQGDQCETMFPAIALGRSRA